MQVYRGGSNSSTTMGTPGGDALSIDEVAGSLRLHCKSVPCSLCVMLLYVYSFCLLRQQVRR